MGLSWGYINLFSVVAIILTVKLGEVSGHIFRTASGLDGGECHDTLTNLRVEHDALAEVSWRYQKAQRDLRECSAMRDLKEKGSNDPKAKAYVGDSISLAELFKRCKHLSEEVTELKKSQHQRQNNVRRFRDAQEKEGGCYTNRAWQLQNPTAILPTHLYAERFDVSFLMQYYKHPQNVAVLVERLYGCTHGPSGDGQLQGLTSELIVNVDSSDEQDVEAWMLGATRLPRLQLHPSISLGVRNLGFLPGARQQQPETPCSGQGHLNLLPGAPPAGAQHPRPPCWWILPTAAFLPEASVPFSLHGTPEMCGRRALLARGGPCPGTQK
ncbi:hypothetical protein CYMTET_26062 [Cymbomonas tetramitiformis]|uniref:Uncharacterized protein n=1 Tax=Cymbomonas tetramitiformis TaxID=36881 RepID=A0AAE0FSH7_9CHLO|nr:hypothetical protein CYMTET_26062 [Cymbomonas tetramitiformis]